MKSAVNKSLTQSLRKSLVAHETEGITLDPSCSCNTLCKLFSCLIKD